MARSRSLLLGACALVLPSLVHGQGSVWVVDDDGGPGVDFTNLEVAIDAAASGDVLLVRDGTYGASGPRFEIEAKGLSLIGDAEVRPVLTSGLSVSNLAAGSQVTLAGLDVQPVSPASGLSIFVCEGLVWVEDCALRGSPGNSGARATSSDQCVFVHSTLHGTAAAQFAQNGPDGLQAGDASVHLFGCEVAGGLGLPNWNAAASSGSGARVFAGSFLFAERSSFLGADDPDPECQVAVGHCDPGHGLYANASEVRLVDCTTAAGTPACGCCGAFDTLGQGFETWSGAARALDVDSPVREGGSGTVDVAGEPGDLALLLVGPASFTVPVPELSGVLLVGPPLQVHTLGTASPTGDLSVPFSVPELGTGVDAVFLDLQLLAVGTDATAVLSEPARLVLLDGSL